MSLSCFMIVTAEIGNYFSRRRGDPPPKDNQTETQDTLALIEERHQRHLLEDRSERFASNTFEKPSEEEASDVITDPSRLLE